MKRGVDKVSEYHSRGIDRRSFLQQAGVAAGGLWLGTGALLAGEPSTSGQLAKRVLGRTGVAVTTMTLGTAPCGFAKPHSTKRVADCVNAAIDLGITAIDTAPAYDIAEEGIGLALGRRRKEVFLSTKVLADSVEEAEKILANSLRKLKTDYVDLLYFHQVGDRKVDIALDPEGVFTWLVKQKKAGKTRFVGISGHNRPGKFTRLLESGQCDVLLTVVNFVDRHTYKFEESVLPVAINHNVGVVAMKVFGGAKNMQYADPNSGAHLDPQYHELAIRYALGVPGVATLNIGCASVEQIRQDVAMVARWQPLSQEELASALAVGKELAARWGTHFGPLARSGAVVPGRC